MGGGRRLEPMMVRSHKRTERGSCVLPVWLFERMPHEIAFHVLQAALSTISLLENI